jgi:ABC-2 type transport system permease protein
LSSYRTDLSFAYSPVKEMIVSLVQEETGRSKAAHYIIQLNEQYQGENSWTWEDISEKSIEIQQDENLLYTAFHYNDSAESPTETSLISWNTWGLWAILSVISTLFLSDWIIREKALAVSTRFSFIKPSHFTYFAFTICIYMALFFLFDIASLTIFSIVLQEKVTIYFLVSLLSFRIMLTLLAFSLAHSFKSSGMYYGMTIIITLIAATISGVVIPVNGFMLKGHWTEIINPLDAFLNERMTVLWLLISMILVLLILTRKERSNA